MFQFSVIKHTLFMIAIAGIISTMPDVSQAHTEIINPIKEGYSALSKIELYTEIPTRVIIPSVNIDVVVNPSTIVNGTWEVHDTTAGYGIGSSHLDDPFGNAIIFAHARVGLFRNLPNVSENDEIFVIGENNIYTYKIITSEKILPNEISKVRSFGGYHLTLFTCEGLRDEYRLLVKAIRVSVAPINSATLII